MFNKKFKALKFLLLGTIILFFSYLLIIGPKTVVIGDPGFQPNSINLIKGTKLSWKVEGSLSHWPASDPHPEHSAYPSVSKGCVGSSLDACRALNSGESYTFIFDKTGSWGIHDHLNHSQTMTVNVYDSVLDLLIAKIKSFFWEFKQTFKKPPERLEQNSLNQATLYCNNPDRTKFISCLKTTLKEPIQKFGVKELMSQLESSFKQNDSSANGGITRCHDIAHAIGQAGIVATSDPKTILSQCSDLCTSGCYHGAVEETVVEQSAENFLNNLNNLCEKEACFHGLGHGLASIGEFDLDKSLKLCDRISTENGKLNCGFGVFMEIYEPSSFNPIPKDLPEDLLGFCASLSEVYQTVCYRNISSYEFARTNQNIDKAFEICRLIPQKYQHECQVALGQQIYFNRQGNSQEIIKLCTTDNKSELTSCINGALMSAVSSDPLIRHGFELCSNIESQFQSSCYQFLGEHIQRVYGQPARVTSCEQLQNNVIVYNRCLGQDH